MPKRGGTLAIFMYYWMNSENIHVLWVTSEQHSLPVMLLELCVHHGKSGRWYNQPCYLEPQLCTLACHPRRLFYCCYTGRPPKTRRQRETNATCGPATEVTHLRLNQPPVFAVVRWLILLTTAVKLTTVQCHVALILSVSLNGRVDLILSTSPTGHVDLGIL